MPSIMGRQSSFMDRQFGRSDVDPDDEGTFEPGLVGVVMPFKRAELVSTPVRDVW